MAEEEKKEEGTKYRVKRPKLQRRRERKREKRRERRATGPKWKGVGITMEEAVKIVRKEILAKKRHDEYNVRATKAFQLRAAMNVRRLKDVTLSSNQLVILSNAIRLAAEVELYGADIAFEKGDELIATIEDLKIYESYLRNDEEFGYDDENGIRQYKVHKLTASKKKNTKLEEMRAARRARAKLKRETRARIVPYEQMKEKAQNKGLNLDFLKDIFDDVDAFKRGEIRITKEISERLAEPLLCGPLKWYKIDQKYIGTMEEGESDD